MVGSTSVPSELRRRAARERSLTQRPFFSQSIYAGAAFSDIRYRPSIRSNGCVQPGDKPLRLPRVPQTTTRNRRYIGADCSIRPCTLCSASRTRARWFREGGRIGGDLNTWCVGSPRLIAGDFDPVGQVGHPLFSYRLVTLSALSLASLAGGIAGIASSLPFGFKDGFPLHPLSEFLIAGLLLGFQRCLPSGRLSGLRRG